MIHEHILLDKKSFSQEKWGVDKWNISTIGDTEMLATSVRATENSIT